jgi:hypothetical protein
MVCYLAWAKVAVPLDVERIQPGEGEVVAAKRLMERVIRCYGRFFDVVMGDALYLETFFVNFFINHVEEILMVLKSK